MNILILYIHTHHRRYTKDLMVLLHLKAVLIGRLTPEFFFLHEETKVGPILGKLQQEASRKGQRASTL